MFDLLQVQPGGGRDLVQLQLGSGQRRRRQGRQEEGDQNQDRQGQRQGVLEQADDFLAPRRPGQGLDRDRTGAGEGVDGWIDVARGPAFDVEIDGGPDRGGSFAAPIGGLVAVTLAVVACDGSGQFAGGDTQNLALYGRPPVRGRGVRPAAAPP